MKFYGVAQGKQQAVTGYVVTDVDGRAVATFVSLADAIEFAHAKNIEALKERSNG